MSQFMKQIEMSNSHFVRHPHQLINFKVYNFVGTYVRGNVFKSSNKLKITPYKNKDKFKSL